MTLVSHAQSFSSLWSVGFLLSQIPSARITVYPVRGDFNTDAGFTSLVSSSSWKFKQMSLWPANSVFSVPAISGASFLPKLS